jgi:diaminopimelate epimerase
MKPIPFAKMSGTGNDFIIIDNRDRIVEDDGLKEFIQNVCRLFQHSRFSVAIF